MLTSILRYVFKILMHKRVRLEGSWWLVIGETTLLLTKNVNFDVKVILTLTNVISSNKIDLQAIDRIYIIIAFNKSKYLSCSAIIFHRLFKHTTVYFQEIYLLFSNSNVSIDLYNKVIEVSPRGTNSVSKVVPTGHI